MRNCILKTHEELQVNVIRVRDIFWPCIEMSLYSLALTINIVLDT